MTARLLLLAILGFSTLLTRAAEPADAAAPPAELTAAIQRQLAERETLQRQASDAQAALGKWYHAALDAVKKDAVSKGDLDAVLITDAERDRLERELTAEEKAKLPPTLRPVRAQFDQARTQRAAQQKTALAASLRTYVASLEALEKRFTQKLDLNGAIAIRQERAAAAGLLASTDTPPAPIAANRPSTPSPTTPKAASPTALAKTPAAATPAPYGTTGHQINIAGRFDTDDLVIQQGSLHIEHRGGTKPENVTVNGRKWALTWLDNRSNDFPLHPPLIFGNAAAVLKKLKTRAQVEIAEHPSPEPGAKLVIRIKDDANGQADVEMTVVW